MTDRAEIDRRWGQLMAAAQAGDRGAYERLLRDVLPFLRAVAARHHRAPDRIEEVVQETLVTVHRVRHTYDPSRPIVPWLAAIAQRRSVDALRRRFRTEAHEVADENAYATYADPGANRSAEASAEAETLGQAIAGLPPQQREALVLVKLRELSLAEASRLSGTSIAALKVNVHRAIKSLRKRLQGAGR